MIRKKSLTYGIFKYACRPFQPMHMVLIMFILLSFHLCYCVIAHAHVSVLLYYIIGNVCSGQCVIVLCHWFAHVMLVLFIYSFLFHVIIILISLFLFILSLLLILRLYFHIWYCYVNICIVVLYLRLIVIY